MHRRALTVTRAALALAGGLAGLTAVTPRAQALILTIPTIPTVSLPVYDSVNQTENRCWSRPAPSSDPTVLSNGRALLSSEQATLLWTAEGDLRLKPTNSFVDYLWSSGTAGVGVAACFRANGDLVVKDAAGAVVWSRSGSSVPTYQGQAYSTYQITLRLDGCALSAGYVRWGSFAGVIDRGDLWSTPATCPPVPQAAIENGWCMDTTEEQTLAKTRWSELVWTTDGNLRLRGLGSAAGTELWRASWATSAYPAAKLCFEDTGRLAIYNTNGGVVWSQGTSTTSGTYYLGLSDCSIETRASAGGNQLWSRPAACPQSRTATGREWVKWNTDRILLENDDATLVLRGGSGGMLSLRDRYGVEYWTSVASGATGDLVKFQADGNLVTYRDAGFAGTSAEPVFATNTENRGVNQMVLERCALRLLAGPTVKWQVGSPTCATTVDNSTPWSMSTSGNLTLLRTAESKLVWQADGNLVLYTLGGGVLWSSHTSDSGRRLAFLADGNLVIYRAGLWGPNDLPVAEWESNTDGVAGPVALTLGDGCTLSLVAGGVTRRTLHSSCRVSQYEFNKSDGDSTLGSWNRSALTSELTGGVARLDNAASLGVRLLGANFELLGASAARLATTAGVESEQATVTVLGESGLSPNVQVEKMFVGREQIVFIGPVPVVIKYGIEGELGLRVGADGGALVVTPHAGLFLMAEAAVGVSAGPLGAKAGLEGSITMVEVELPFRLDISTSDGQHTYDLRADVHIETLTGTLAVFAKAYVKVLGVKLSAKWSHELFGWKGIAWDKNLFHKTGNF